MRSRGEKERRRNKRNKRGDWRLGGKEMRRERK